MRKELEKSCEINELLCKFYEGISNFQTDTVFDHSECQYTAIHMDNRQSLFILRRVDAEHADAQVKDQVIISTEKEEIKC